MAICYKFDLSTYVQEPLVIGRRACMGRDLNGETVGCRLQTLAVQRESSRVQELM